jgi:hypothetical protein
VAPGDSHPRVESGWIRWQDAGVQINAAVPYDEQQLRATLTFIIRPQVRRVRVYGWIFTAIGLVLVAATLTSPDVSLTVGGVFMVAFGLYFAFGIMPRSISRAISRQPRITRDGYWLTLDDEWLQVTYPLVQSRFRWAGVERIVDTPTAWYVRFSRIQAIAIPKARLSAEQQAEFAGFLAQRQPVVQA